MLNRRNALVGLLLAAVLPACGSRAEPMPPLRPEAPPFANVVIAQLGNNVILEFDPMPETVTVAGEEVTLREVEVLMLAELYPLITAEMLAAALPDERRLRVREVREATNVVAERLDRDRDARAAALAAEQGVEVVATEEVAEEEPDSAGAGDEPLTEEELLLRRVPRNAMTSWREAGVPPDAVLEAARRLDSAVDALWNELRLPTAIINRSEPLELPAPDAILAAANAVASRIRYETGRDLAEFLELSTVVRTIPYEELENYLVGTKVVLVEPVGVGAAAGDAVRTRYWFGARGRSTRNHPGVVQTVGSLAPSPVPGPPSALNGTLTEKSVKLTWEAPTLDLAGAVLPADRIRYNVYRRVVPPQQAATAAANAEATTPQEDRASTTDAATLREGRPGARTGRTARPAVPAPALLTPLPIGEREFEDLSVTLGRTYVYEVRALLAPAPERAVTPQTAVAQVVTTPKVIPVAIPGPRKEGPGLATGELIARDTYPPAKVTALTAVRAGNRVSLRWTASTSTDVTGYRVYRHQMPAPALPAGRFTPTAGATPPTPAAAGEGQPAAAVPERPTGATPPLAGEMEVPATGETPPTQDEEVGRQRNELVVAGWELLTSPRTNETRYTDPTSDPMVGWMYLVEAIDAAGNVSLLERVVVAAEGQQ